MTHLQETPITPVSALPQTIMQEAQEKWDLFEKACENHILPKAIPSAFHERLMKSFGLSDFIAKTAVKTPELLLQLIASDTLHRSYAKDEYTVKLAEIFRNTTSEADVMTQLRRVRNREMIRIAYRDLNGLAGLSETMRDLTLLATECVDTAFRWLFDRLCDQYGAPLNAAGDIQNIVVLGFGKIGAYELNFSSDIDLVFAFPENGMTQNEALDNNTFFVHLCRKFIKIFEGHTADGILFRVDLRLRPFGENGPLVMSFDAMQNYYEEHGRDWERYAAIKARVIAGDKTAGQKFLMRIKPFVYRRYLDYAAFDALREMKAKIALQVQKKGWRNNIKLGPGGIREIEFFGQIFQLIRGGLIYELQDRRILTVLSILVHKGFIPASVRDELQEAYYFLRYTENRLQAYADQQTHQLPGDSLVRQKLAVSMGYATWEAFHKMLSGHMQAVHLHFNALLLSDETEDAMDDADTFKGVWAQVIQGEAAMEVLTAAGFEAPKEALSVLTELFEDASTRALSDDARRRIDKLIPIVLKKVGQADDPNQMLKHMSHLIQSIQRRTCYIALLLENPTVLDHLIRLASASPWIMTFLSQHPVLLDELIDSRTLYSPPSREDLTADIEQRLTKIASEDLEIQLQELCIFKQVNTLRVAAADISGQYPLMKVSDHLTDIAETVLQTIHLIIFRYLTEKYGRPAVTDASISEETGFAIIAYGKLGGIELGYGSDLDMVFLYDGDRGETTGQARTCDCIQFYSYLGQRINHALTLYTSTGKLYETDLRLRPNGASGVLVSSLTSYEEYLFKNAWTWEHQALVRARFVAGDPLVKIRFEAIRQNVLSQKRDPAKLKQEVFEMRQKMRATHSTGPSADVFDLKQGKGGIVDIEFIVQYLVLLHANEKNELTRWTDNVRQLETLVSSRILSEKEAVSLKDAYLAFRAKVHRQNLLKKSSKVAPEPFERHLEAVKRVWDKVFCH